MRPLLLAAALVAAVAGCLDAPEDEGPEPSSDGPAGASAPTSPEPPSVGDSLGDPPGNATGLGSGAHFCQLQPDGAVKCWGDNQAGQLGATSGPD